MEIQQTKYAYNTLYFINNKVFKLFKLKFFFNISLYTIGLLFYFYLDSLNLIHIKKLNLFFLHNFVS